MFEGPKLRFQRKVKLKNAVRYIVNLMGYDFVKRENAEALRQLQIGAQPGHFYSPIPSKDEVTRRAESIFSKNIEVPNIDLNLESQLDLLRQFNSLGEYYSAHSLHENNRYNIENDYFTFDDAPILSYMLRTLQPTKVIEIGSGYSSACMLDVAEKHLSDRVQFTFIDIDLERLKNLLLPEDLLKIELVENQIQEIDLGIFTNLSAGDMLFIDSSHVLKTGSDVHTIFFEILPLLKPGVYIHFHDIRYPFQYEIDLVLKDNVFWNEAYALRAFLMHNSDYEIVFWLNYLLNSGSPEVPALTNFLPLAQWDNRFKGGAGDYTSAGGSIYIMKK